MVASPARRCTFCKVRTASPLCARFARGRGLFQRDRTTHTFKRGQLVFHAGAPAHALYVVRDGRVKVYRTLSDGQERALRLLGPGEILGYRPLLAGEPYMASAEAVEDSTLCIVPWPTVLEMLRADPDLALELLAKLARELRVSEDLMMDVVSQPARRRVARLLLRLCVEDQDGEEQGSVLSHQLRRRDMARMIAITPETLSRVLRTLARDGIVSLTRSRIQVRDAGRLRRAAGD